MKSSIRHFIGFLQQEARITSLIAFVFSVVALVLGVLRFFSGNWSPNSRISFVMNGLRATTDSDLDSLLFAVIAFSLICFSISGVFYLRERLLQKQFRIMQSRWAYTLYRKDGDLYLEVLYGTSAMVELTLPLTQEERQAFWLEGRAYIETIADEITQYGMKSEQYGKRLQH